MTVHDRILFLGTREDHSFLPRLKPLVNGASVAVDLKPISTKTEVLLNAKAKHATAIVTTSSELLTKLVPEGKPSIDNYAGSLFVENGMEILFIDPLSHLISVPYGAFLTKRFLSKLVGGHHWFAMPEFEWKLATVSDYEEMFNACENALAVAIDIETVSKPINKITCISYACISKDLKRITTYVIALDSVAALYQMRRCNATSSEKIFQNGKYDNFWFIYFNAPVTNWLWDTQHWFHAAYSELPKDLGFLQSFHVRESKYWKDLAKTGDLYEYYEYNARDSHGTACTWLVQMLDAQEYQQVNYVKEFPMVYPALVCELTGVKRDMAVLKKVHDETIVSQNAIQKSLDTCVGGPLNVNSYKQVRSLLAVLGIANVDESDETALKKFSYLHPLNAFLCNKILEIRGSRKLLSTYLVMEGDYSASGKPAIPAEYYGRILYSLNPHGTDTLRFASRESALWCGWNIQNVPRDDSVKQTVVADDGFLFGECDFKMAESYGTAYCSGDANLLIAVNSEQDFHSRNASAFFGLPYDTIYDDVIRECLNKPIRQLSKNVNHGANYCMGALVLLDTMGYENVGIAKKLLNLPKWWSPVQVCEHLLAGFHRTYPGLEGSYYPAIWREIQLTGRLVSPLGWTRICFKDTKKDKRARNAYVAHVGQNLNAEILNDALHRVFYEVWLPNFTNFKLVAPIHDSILFQFREGFEHLARDVKRIMEECSTRDILGYDKVSREMKVPAELKKFGKYWSECT